MAVSLDSLLTPVTEEQALDATLALLEALGFEPTTWQDGSSAKTLVRLMAHIYSSVSAVVPAIVAGGFNALAVSGWLDVLSEDYYANERVDAVATQGVFRFTSTATAPPYVISVGDLQIADSATATPTTQTFRNTSAGTLNPGSTLDLTVEGEIAGADGNIPNSTPLYMWTALVGVTVTNPAVGGSSSWITRAGTDEETDARLRERNTSRWSTLSYAATEGAYRNWALAADASVTRVKVRANNPYGPGTVDVVCATAIGGISAGQALAIVDYIDGLTDGIGRRPLGDVVTVQSASAIAFTISGTVTVAAAYQSATTATVIQQALRDVLHATPIGGTIIPPASSGVIVKSKLIAAVEALDGVLAVTLSAPAGDTGLSELEVIDDAQIAFGSLSVVYG